MKPLAYLIPAITFLCSCSAVPENPTKVDAPPTICPDYVAVTIPAGIAPLNFYIDNDSIDLLDVIVRGAKGEELTCSGEYADFDIDKWHSLTTRNAGDSLQVTVRARKCGEWIEYKPFPIYISKDSLGEWGVTYRLIPPGYETYGLMGLYQRDLSNFDETPIVENKNVDSDCMNCHTTNRTDPSNFTFHIRGEHGATVVGHNGELDILAPRNQDLGGSMVYPFWHPSGRFIAYSTNQTHQNFHQLRDRRVEVYDDKSDIIIYSPASHQIIMDSIVATRDHLENFPTFSPDGKWLYFCSANRVDSIWKQYKDIKYNICRVSFDSESGKLGTDVDTIVNARSLGKSANMPRLSYDGRFLLYTICDYGCFPIWHPEADLWMMNLESGETWPLAEANSADSESFHNWSLNSRWVLFTSRRDDGLYTQLYFSHIDNEGKASKPFRLPQRNPREYDIETVNSFNTPDFAKSPIDLIKRDIYQRLKSQERSSTTLISE
ncbi:MAG: PD40 domain-containing protein [Prevotella sp.]|nr:PD40 domain-containing protein [Prevotella sp.]MBR1556779.1 PD40 domain-containing protein [Prevotella sp.]